MSNHTAPSNIIQLAEAACCAKGGVPLGDSIWKVELSSRRDFTERWKICGTWYEMKILDSSAFTLDPNILQVSSSTIECKYINIVFIFVNVYVIIRHTHTQEKLWPTLTSYLNGLNNYLYSTSCSTSAISHWFAMLVMAGHGYPGTVWVRRLCSSPFNKRVQMGPVQKRFVCHILYITLCSFLKNYETYLR